MTRKAYFHSSLTWERDAELPQGSGLLRDVLPGGTQPGGVPGPSSEAWPGPEQMKDLRWQWGWGIPNTRQGGQAGCSALLSPGSQVQITAWAFFFFKFSPPWSVVWWGQFELCLPGTYVSRWEDANYLHLKIDWENMFSLVVLLWGFFIPLADCPVVLMAERKIKTPLQIRHSRLISVWVAM